jgi:UDP-N-acetylglucosamine:LPS N-acetylglucosamine transferase
MKKVIAAASFGGHWIQLQRLKPLFDRYDTTYISTRPDAGASLLPNRYMTVIDAASDSKFRLALLFLQALIITIRVRPDVVISTGAAPGLAFILWGRVFGAKTIWIDSIANAEKMSKSGMIAKHWSTMWLSQWKDVADKWGANYFGKVI